tara:strand:- start:63 stop:263 length:201 start_codon:yes stop_codon:yes gene_type:complete
MVTGRKKTKKQRDKSARASLHEIIPGVHGNKNMEKELKRLGIDPADLLKIKSSGMGTHYNWKGKKL